MSVQLIVFPQNYDGQYNAFSTSATEAVVNGINFTGLGSATSYDSSAANVSLDVLANEPPLIVNTWYRFRSTSSGTPSLPTVTAANLVLNSTTTSTVSGVYQQLTNLSVGQQYTFTINISTPAANGSIIVSAFDGVTTVSTNLQAASLSQITHSFTATSTNNTIMITYFNTVANNVTISGISLQPLGTTPNFTNFELEDGQVICDLYEDEDIPLSLSVDNFKNVAEKVQSYSKAFNLPATKRNNLIFDNMFEITRTDDGVIFNPYNKTECVLKQDGFILFKGYLKMLDVTDKDGEISYNVNLYSEVIALADILQDRTFSELGLTELEHAYNLTNIQLTWVATGVTYLNASTSGYRSATTVKYPFVDWNHQYILGASGNPVLPNLESAFRPFIQIKYLINRIFEATPFTWESDFFDSPEFEKLYMDFNWGSDNAPVVFNSSGGLTRLTDQSLTTSYTTLDFQDNLNATLSSDFGYSSGTFTAQEDGQVYDIAYDMRFKTPVATEVLDVQWVLNGVPIGGQAAYSQSVTNSGWNFVGNFITPPLSSGDTLLCQAKSSSTTMDLLKNVFPATGTAVFSYDLVTTTTSSNQTTSNTLLGTLRGELGQWEFLKGIMTMFNIVSVPDEDNPNNIKLEPYGDVFIQNTAGKTLASRSIQHDWTDLIDVAEMKLTPLTDLNKNTVFKFVEDDDDFAFANYKKQVGGHLYGSKKWDASIASNGLATILQGTEEIIAEPFAATVVKPLMTQYPDFITPSLYAMSDDETEGFENSPRILFDNGVKSAAAGTFTSCTYSIPAQNGVGASALTNQFLQFSHLTDIPTALATQDFHFGDCQLIEGVGASPPDNLFNLYWLPYYAELYNPDTRMMTIKVNLSPSIINTFKFNDTVMIKNREFRVNNIEYKPNDLATVEFILIP